MLIGLGILRLAYLKGFSGFRVDRYLGSRWYVAGLSTKHPVKDRIVCCGRCNEGAFCIAHFAETLSKELSEL